MTAEGSRIELPAYATSLVGRGSAQTHLITLLESDQRLITLVGSSGAGKTRLALQLAVAVGHAYDRVTFVALAPVRLPILVMPTILQTLGLQEGAESSALDVLAATFADQRLLLLLDNFEQVREAGVAIMALLERLPLLQVLVTSQDALAVDMETVFEVPPLPYPDDATLSLDAALEYPAVRLFVERIQAVQRHFVAYEEDVPAIIDICRRVRGLPLAIELIAAHSEVLRPTDLSMLVRNHLSIGRTMTIPRAVSRQEILWPVLDWCYRMLDPQLQICFDRLGVFLGGCSVDSAAAICNYAADFELEMSSMLHALVSKHLIQAETLTAQNTRYIMLDSVQEYAHERLKRHRDSAAVYAAHVSYYMGFAQQAYAAMHGPDQAVWFQRLNEDIHNIRQVITYLYDTHDVEQGLILCSTMYVFWQMQGLLTEGSRWLEQGLTYKDQVAPSVVAAAQHALGVLRWSQGRFKEAQRLSQANILIQEALGDTEGLIKSYNNLATLEYNYANYAESIALYLKCIEALKVLNDVPRLAVVMNNLGNVYTVVKDFEKAWAYKHESLRLRREIGNDVNIAYSLSSLGRDAIEEGSYQQALAYLEEGQQVLERVQERFVMVSVLSNLGLVHWRLDHPMLAQKYAAESVFLAHSVGDLQGLPDAILVLAIVYAHQFPQLMARLVGATQAYLEQRQTPLSPYSQSVYDEAEVRLNQFVPNLEELLNDGAAESFDSLLSVLEAQLMTGS